MKIFDQLKLRLDVNQSNLAKCLFIGIALFLLSTQPSAAQDFGGVTTFLQAIVDAITGPIGVAVAALAVMAIGFSFMTGRMDWTFAVAVILGIAIVFGGASFVQGISAS